MSDESTREFRTLHSVIFAKTKRWFFRFRPVCIAAHFCLPDISIFWLFYTRPVYNLPQIFTKLARGTFTSFQCLRNVVGPVSSEIRNTGIIVVFDFCIISYFLQQAELGKISVPDLHIEMPPRSGSSWADPDEGGKKA